VSALSIRDNYLRAVRREGPDWVPWYCGFTPGALEKFKAATGREDYRDFFQFPWKWLTLPRREAASQARDPGDFLKYYEDIEDVQESWIEADIIHKVLLIPGLNLGQSHRSRQVSQGCAQNVVAHKVVVAALTAYVHRYFIFSVMEEDIVLVDISIYRIAGIGIDTDLILAEDVMIDPIVQPFLLTVDVYGHGTVIHQHIVSHDAPLRSQLDPFMISPLHVSIPLRSGFVFFVGSSTIKDYVPFDEGTVCVRVCR